MRDMKCLSGILVVVLAALPSVQVFAGEGACLEGDTQRGPNCVHEESRSLRDPISTVYRVTGKRVRVVWDGVGTVKTSTPEYIVVTEPVSDDSGQVRLDDVRYDWNGSTYGR